MTDEEKQVWVAEQMAKFRKIYAKVKPRCMRREKRIDRQLPIRQVMGVYIFMIHERRLYDKWMFDDLDIRTKLKPYKNWEV